MSRYSSPSRPRPTLLVFSLGSDADCRRRPLLPGRLVPLERELRQRSLARLLDAGRKVGLDLELATRPGAGTPSDERRDGVRRFAQRGASFGERLVDALERSRSYNPGSTTVLVGGDTPELGAKHLRRALHLTRRDPDCVVLGPSRDGGFYLLAASRPVDEALRDVRWCGARARRDLVAALRAEGRRVHLLEPLSDLDRPSDLVALLSREWSKAVAARIATQILAALRELARPLVRPEPRRLVPCAVVVPARRGPPA